MENIYIEKDIKIAIRRITQIICFLIECQKRIKGLPSLEIKQNVFSRGYIDIDFQYIAEQTYRTIRGELKNIPIDGALDQWITNEDFLLDANKMKSLTAIYKYN